MASVHPHEKFDRRLNFVLAMTALLVIGGVLMAIIVGPAIFTGRNNSSQVIRGNDLNACRGQVHTLIDDAQAQLLIETTTLQEIIADGLQATIKNDQQAVADALVAKAAARDRIDAAKDRLDQATTTYRAAVRRSQQNPSGFLRQFHCG